MSELCLRSGVELQNVTVGGITFRLSRKTGGIWLENHVMSDILKSTDAVKEEIVDLMTVEGRDEYDLDERLSNPSNDLVMTRTPIAFCSLLTIDQCPETGGVWIDGQDRPDLLEIFKHSKYLDRKEKRGTRGNSIPDASKQKKAAQYVESVTPANTLNEENYHTAASDGFAPQNSLLEEAFSWKGRIGRWTYIKWRLIIVFAPGLFASFMIPFLSRRINSGDEASAGLLMGLLLIAFLLYVVLAMVIAISTSVRRFHDLGKSGWFVLGALIPLFNLYLFFLVTCLPGDDGENDYGYPPL